MAKFIYGVDIGGTSVKMGLFDSEGEVIEKWEIPTQKENKGEQILPDIARSIQEKNTERSIANEDILGIGMGVPGPITEDGRVLNCVNLGWGIFSVADRVRELTGIEKVKIGNDANVAALGEQWRGGGRSFDSIVMVTLGTGVGGGVILNGKILTGANGAAGEIGHIPVTIDGSRPCTCGKTGCLEQYSSATAIMRKARELVENTDTPSMMRDYEKITGKEIFAAYEAGDALAAEVVDEFAQYLGLGLAQVAQVVDPQAFVIGGGVSKNGPVVTEVIQKEYKKNAMFAMQDTEFCLAELGNDAGIYGAVKMILN